MLPFLMHFHVPYIAELEALLYIGDQIRTEKQVVQILMIEEKYGQSVEPIYYSKGIARKAKTQLQVPGHIA